MLVNAKELKGLTLQATDGELGTVDQFFFDDQEWIIRYVTVETGREMSIHRVLIATMSIEHVDWESGRLFVALTKMQIANSPTVDSHQPVSRQHETIVLEYYGYGRYWSNDELQESHLVSEEEVVGYHVDATDGEIGHVDGFAIDDEDWSLRYVEVATRNWLPGKKVLLSTAWVEQVRWDDSKVSVDVSREAIKSAPAYDDSKAVARDYEARIYSHYGRPPYWIQGRAVGSARSFTGN